MREVFLIEDDKEKRKTSLLFREGFVFIEGEKVFSERLERFSSQEKKKVFSDKGFSQNLKWLLLYYSPKSV